MPTHGVGMVVAVTEEVDIREDFLEGIAVFLVASLAPGEQAAKDLVNIRPLAVGEAMAEDTAAVATAALSGATLRDITTVRTTTREAITEVIPDTTTEGGLPMVQPLGSFSAG